MAVKVKPVFWINLLPGSLASQALAVSQISNDALVAELAAEVGWVQPGTPFWVALRLAPAEP